MRRRISLLIAVTTALLVAGSSAPCRAQSMNSVLTNMPSEELPMLGESARLDLLDFYDSQMEAGALNTFGGITTLKKKTDNFLCLQLTEASWWEARRIVLQGDTLIVCIHSVGTPAMESFVRIYSAGLERIDTMCVQRPATEAFWKPTPDSLSSDRLAYLRQIAATLPVAIHWNEEDEAPACLTFSLSTDDLGQEDKQDIGLCLQPVVLKAEECLLAQP